ncbi:MAG TPA: hypothetical protein DCX07_13885 [Phycisphaerales bacterium]|nr:hypothetical protein [Phycisphaerales bacterium]
MRSIRYLLGGSPRTLDDCVDFARQRRPDSVLLELRTETFADDLGLLTQWVARTIWRFGDRLVVAESVCGGVPTFTAESLHRSALAEANRRLAHWIQRIERTGAHVAAPQTAFEPPARALPAA